MLKDALLDLTNRGDVVIDPSLGSDFDAHRRPQHARLNQNPSLFPRAMAMP
jgi:hypothetical protein